VRTGKDPTSPEVHGRLSTGALVIALEHDTEAERMMFEKVIGTGPATGWVSTMFRGKELLIPSEDEVSTDEPSDADVAIDDVSAVADTEEAEDARELAIQLYCARFGEAEVAEGSARALAGEAAALGAEGREGNELPETEVCAELEQHLIGEWPSLKPADEEDDEETPDCDLVLCQHCRLPVGQVAYAAEGTAGGLLHGECKAQQLLRYTQRAEREREAAKAATKRERREEFDIGWKHQRIPSNAGSAARLSCPVPQGMCCLVFHEGSRSVSLASTIEPAAAVNLDYLSTALAVRRRENREPLFSLDPADAGSEFFDPKQSMQVKRFEPAWLAGTNVGEVLFQSDYHLKELSMGEYEQPIVGMKSCHDLSTADGPEWSAREWFVVRKAEVQMSGDNVLMPYVKMGVEAREQIISECGLEDVRTTKPNHPLVKYAEMFTHNFDLIAERKSVVFHLRELAKASILAKFLLEADIDLDDSWFAMADNATEACCLEIPQLWNDRSHSQIQVQDGRIVNADTSTSSQSLYGGVQFGLDKFQLAGARQPARMMSAGLAARQFVQPARHLSATLSAGLATRQFQRSFGPMGVQPARVAGVDLNLDEFNLSAPTDVDICVQLDIGADMSGAFWSNLSHEAPSMFSEDDKRLLRSVFNPSLSDRRDEGNRFIPPDTSFAYVQKLRALVQEEEAVQQQRKDHFFSKLFSHENPGSLFPSSWGSSVEILRQDATMKQGCHLHPILDYKAKSLAWDHALKSAVPVFDKTTENGTRFRIYQFGSMEVRTTQELDGTETIGVVFSSRVSKEGSENDQRGVKDNERIVKVSEYVEKSEGVPRCYVVLETDQKSVILTEELPDGTVKREHNPKDLDERNSLAKLVRHTPDCSAFNITVNDIKHCRRDVYNFVSGDAAASGFIAKETSGE